MSQLRFLVTDRECTLEGQIRSLESPFCVSMVARLLRAPNKISRELKLAFLGYDKCGC